MIVAEIGRKRPGPRADNASTSVSGDQTDQREIGAAEESNGSAFCQLDTYEMASRLLLGLKPLRWLFQWWAIGWPYLGHQQCKHEE